MTTTEKGSPVISVFGSSYPRPGMPAYEEARHLGRLLAELGYTVATGGYMGTMEAASRGAAEAGGHVIGVICDQIEHFRPVSPNPWVREAIRYPTLRDRLLHLVKENAGMIVLPGGIGTLSEMALAWSFLQVGEIAPRPLVLMGMLWRDTMTSFITNDYVSPQHAALVCFADEPAQAVAHLLPAGRW